MIYVYLYLLALLMIIALGAAMRRTWVCLVCWTIAVVMVVLPMGFVIYALQALKHGQVRFG